MTEGFKPIIAVDFDGVLSHEKWPGTGKPNTSLMKWLIQQRNKGHKVILNTCRNGEPLEDAIRFCKVYGLEFDAVNENLPEIVETYGSSDSRKITAYYYLDDRAVNTRSYDWDYMALHKLDLPMWEEE